MIFNPYEKMAISYNIPNIIEKYSGEIYYSPCFGPVEFIHIDQDNCIVCKLVNDKSKTIKFNSNGSYVDGGECMLFPDKDNKDWEDYDYIKRNCPGWDEYIKETGDNIVFHNINLNMYIPFDKFESSVIAYIKLYKIVNHFYKTCKNPDIGISKKFNILSYYDEDYCKGSPCLFETYEMARNFLKNNENVKLLKQFYDV